MKARRIVYFLIYFATFLLAHLLFFLLPKKLRTGITLKWKTFFRSSPGTGSESGSAKWSERPICIHAASGEVEYAKSLLREIKRTFPKIPIILTYSSPSIFKLIKNLQDISLVTAAPFDLPWMVRSFLDKYNPQLVLYARTDVWPEFANQCAERKVPQILFSATFANDSSRLRFVGRFFTQLALQVLTEIHSVEQEDSENLRQKLNIPSLVSGDTRYDQVFYRLFHERQNHSFKSPFANYAVFGSTWPQDDFVLLKSLPTVLQNHLRIVWVPHEISAPHIGKLKSSIEELGYKTGLSKLTKDSKESNQGDNIDVLIVNEVGLLAEIYAKAQWAFVGGSFRKQVHSVMEPLACGLRVIVGPKITNNREAVVFSKQQLEQLPIVIEVTNSKEFNQAVLRIQKLHLSQDRQNIKSILEKKKGATQTILNHCRNFLKSDPSTLR